MNATALSPMVGVDLSKNVFELAVADAQWRVVERARLTRSQFEHWCAKRAVGLVVMEACGSAHHWGRWLTGMGIEVRLLPARYVRAYVKRNKPMRLTPRPCWKPRVLPTSCRCASRVSSSKRCNHCIGSVRCG